MAWGVHNFLLVSATVGVNYKPIKRGELQAYYHIHAIIRHTNKHLGLIMTLLYSLLDSAKRSPYYQPLCARNSTLTRELDPDL